MNFGPCPYGSGALLMLELPDADLPVTAAFDCEDCHRKIWYVFSRLNPQAYTEEEFLDRYDVDDSSRKATERRTALPGRSNDD